MSWTYNPKRGTYTSKSGLIVGRADQASIRKDFINSLRGDQEILNAKLADNTISISDWVLGQRALIKQAHLAEYLLARGGKGAMTSKDYGFLGSTLRKQYRYLNRFGQDLISEKVSIDQLSNRSSQYLDTAASSFHRGFTNAMGIPRLPAYPCDGSTACLGSCRCSWDITEDEQGWYATWQAEDKPCPTCSEYAERWNPLFIPKPGMALLSSEEIAQ